MDNVSAVKSGEKMCARQLLEVVSIIGKNLLKYGAEVYRAEESMRRICARYGYENAEVFAVPCTVIVTLFTDGAAPLTVCVNAEERLSNLDRVGQYSSLSRKICKDAPAYGEIIAEIARIESRREYPKFLRLICYMIVGFSFVPFFGGSLVMAIFGAADAAAVFFLSEIADRLKSGFFLKNLLCSALAAAFALICGALNLIPSYDTVIISALMTLVPGVTITNCMRDFISGDLLAGLYTMSEAFTTAIALASGAGAVLAIFG